MTISSKRSATVWLTTLGAALLLAACGGGGGGGGSAPPTPAPPPPPAPAPPSGTAFADPCVGGANFGVAALGGASVGKQASAAVVGCSGPLSNPQWVQTEGPAVELLSAKTQVIQFDVATAGTYAFRVSFNDASGVARTQDVRMTLTAPAVPARALARGHQAVRMGGGTSMRAWAAPGQTLSSVTWTQVDGPAVTFAAVDPFATSFRAPTVTRDTLLRLRATINTSAGAETDEVLVLVERHDQAPASNTAAIWSGDHISRVYPYRPTARYASALVPCAYDSAQTESNLCALSRLPFLGQETNGAMPTVEQVMDRVVVSHDWMGVNFERFLRTQDTRGDFRRMLMSTTAVVIGAHVRPSFYYAGTGAIYLDADYVWLTPAERDTIDELPDFRAGFGNELQYYSPWRYVKNNNYASLYFDPQRRVTRTLDDAMPDKAALMYHELLHALDFMPPSQYAGLNNALTVWGNISPRAQARQLVSDLLASRFGLTSAEHKALGQVQFQGATATATQRAYTADQVGAFFATDIATDTYAYSSIREDLAMGVEELLMSSRLGLQRDVGFIPKIGTDFQFGNVRWGQRGRVGDPTIKPRVRDAAAQVVPWLDASAIDGLPAPVALRVGASWNANLNPAPLGPLEASPDKRSLSAADAWRMRRAMERQRVHDQPKRLPGEAR